MGSSNSKLISRLKNKNKNKNRGRKKGHVNYTDEEKESVIALYLNSDISLRALARESGIPFNTLGFWTSGLRERRARSKYSIEKKKLAMKLCRRKGATYKEVAQELEVPLSTLKDWISEIKAKKSKKDHFSDDEEQESEENIPENDQSLQQSEIDNLMTRIIAEMDDENVNNLIGESSEIVHDVPIEWECNSRSLTTEQLQSECDPFLQFHSKETITEQGALPNLTNEENNTLQDVLIEGADNIFQNIKEVETVLQNATSVEAENTLQNVISEETVDNHDNESSFAELTNVVLNDDFIQWDCDDQTLAPTQLQIDCDPGLKVHNEKINTEEGPIFQNELFQELDISDFMFDWTRQEEEDFMKSIGLLK